jgi:DNA-binding GntR family transcriptional regulator
MLDTRIKVVALRQPPSRGAWRHELVRILLGEIFDGTIPAGSRLIVLNLAERFGLSSTPVRESLLELEAVGVVQFMHNRGAVVKSFGPKELQEIYQLRRILEVEATRLACGRLDKTALDSLRQDLLKLGNHRRNKQWLEREMATDRALHEMIVRGTDNARLAQEIHRYDTLVQALRDVVGGDRYAVHQAVTEHLAIVDAMIANNPTVAAEAMSLHIERAAKSAEAVLFARK